MWTLTLLAALSLAPGQAGELELTNIRATYGFLGPTRPDSRLLPGDTFFVAFDIDNIRVDNTGKLRYSMVMEVTDSKNKVWFKRDPQELEGLNSLGGNHLPAFARVDLGLDQPPDQYTLKLSVTDRAAKTTKSFERKFEVLPKGFGLVRLQMTADPSGVLPGPALGVPGQTLWAHLTAVGLERGGDKKEPDMTIEMQVFDESDKPTLEKPVTGDCKELPKDVNVQPMDFPLTLNRPGKFTVRLKAVDKIARKTAEMAFPIMVVEVK
jgi:hypothetical protein